MYTAGEHIIAHFTFDKMNRFCATNDRNARWRANAAKLASHKWCSRRHFTKHTSKRTRFV